MGNAMQEPHYKKGENMIEDKKRTKQPQNLDLLQHKLLCQ